MIWKLRLFTPTIFKKCIKPPCLESRQRSTPLGEVHCTYVTYKDMLYLGGLWDDQSYLVVLCMTWKDELPLKFPSMKSLWFLVSCLSSWSSKEEINMAKFIFSVFEATFIFVLKSSFSNAKIEGKQMDIEGQ